MVDTSASLLVEGGISVTIFSLDAYLGSERLLSRYVWLYKEHTQDQTSRDVTNVSPVKPHKLKVDKKLQQNRRVQIKKTRVRK